jgi:hypothetical protein
LLSEAGDEILEVLAQSRGLYHDALVALADEMERRAAAAYTATLDGWARHERLTAIGHQLRERAARLARKRVR